MTAINRYKGLRILIMLTIVLVVSRGLCGIFFGHGFIDFPCSVKHVAADHCIDTAFPPHTAEAGMQIKAFLTSYAPDFLGGSCNYTESTSTTLNMRMGALPLNLERSGDVLKVNGEMLDTGSYFHYTQFWTANPWLVSDVEFENLGPVTTCTNTSAETTIAVIGSEGTSLSCIKGLSILLGLGVGLWIVNRQLRRLKGAAATGPERPTIPDSTFSGGKLT